MKWFLIVFTVVVLLDATFDLGKWALGRYTAVAPWLSIVILVLFSITLALIVEYIQRVRRRPQGFLRYAHHGASVWVRKESKGKHRQQCLCFNCRYFKEGDPPPADNCPIAMEFFALCRKHRLSTVTWECPHFTPRKVVKG